MASNSMNDKWLRPVLALCALAGLLALGGCGGGSGAPNNPFAPKPAPVGPLFVLPPTAVVYSHTPATLQVSGGATPYQAFSSNSAVLPVAQNVDTGVVVLVAGDVTADTAIRLGRYFGTDPRFWLNLQATHDLSKAEKVHSYKKIVPRKVA